MIAIYNYVSSGGSQMTNSGHHEGRVRAHSASRYSIGDSLGAEGANWRQRSAGRVLA